MVDFPIYPSSERTVSFVTPFRRFVVNIKTFYCTIPQALRASSLYTREPLPCPIFHPHTIQQIAQQIPIFVPQNDTERVRLGTKTDHVRHDLAARPAGKFQFISPVCSHVPAIKKKIRKLQGSSRNIFACRGFPLGQGVVKYGQRKIDN